ncbi:hypothetical protein OAO01_01145 [Oligoflexia bacterium]|nr:hypothetical protein [Oligoflexia bacterium]
MRRVAYYGVLLFLVMLLLACSGRVLSVTAVPSEDQQAVYARGKAMLHHGLSGKIDASFIAYRKDSALIEVAVINDQKQTFLFGPENVTVQLKGSSGAASPCVVYTFEQLLSQGDSSFAWDGVSSAVGIAGSFIPGGWGSTVAQSVLKMGVKEGKRQSAEPEELSPKAIKDRYLRLHSLSPDSEYYAGLLKIGLPRTVKGGDLLEIRVNFLEQREQLTFHFEKPQK